MINNSEDFSRIYSDLLSRHDYKGLIGLLSTSTFNDENTRTTANKLIEQFQEQADIEDKLLEGADDNIKLAYRFITSGPSSNDISIDESNPLYNSPSSRFMRGWNSLADENNKINITFNNEEEYTKFINSLGGSEEKVRAKGINLESNYAISFNTDVTDKISIYNALKDSGTFDYSEDNNLSDRYNYKGLSQEGAPTASSKQVIIDDYGNMYSPGETGALVSKKSINAHKFNEMTLAVKEANDSYAKLFEAKDIKPYINEMIVTGYMGEDDRQLQQSFSAGLLDLQSFKAMREILEEKYNRVLQTKSLSQYDVWAMNEDNEGSQVLEPLEDNLAKSEIDIEINQAIADGRLHYSHATNGLDIGTMLVIDPRVDKDGKVVGDSKPIRLFVKDLFKSQAENALRDDTQITAQRQYAKHQTYGHVYRGADGSIISDWDQTTDSAIYTDRNGTRQTVDKAQLLDILDTDVIAKRMIDYYSLANKTDKYGDGYTEEFYKVYGSNGFNSKTLYDNISAKAFAAMSRKYAGQSQEFINYKAQELVGTILKGINVNFDGDLDTSVNRSMYNVLPDVTITGPSNRNTNVR